MKEIETKYNHLKIEDGKYANWKKAGYFNSGDGETVQGSNKKFYGIQDG